MSSQNPRCQLSPGAISIWEGDHTKVGSVGPSEDVLIVLQ